MSDQTPGYYLRVYILPVLILFGTILNLLSFMVMRRMQSFSTTSKYMAALGLIDSGVLIIGGCSNFVSTYIVDQFTNSLFSKLSCKLISFSFYFMADLSVFIIVIMTAERFYAVWRPVQASTLSKKKKFRLNMCVSVVLAILVNCHFLFTHSIYRDEKQMIPEDANSTLSNHFSSPVNNHQDTNAMDRCIYESYYSKFYDHYWIFIDASIYSFFPSFLLIVFNFLIIKNLFKARKESNKLNEVGIMFIPTHFSYRSPIHTNTQSLNKKDINFICNSISTQGTGSLLKRNNKGGGLDSGGINRNPSRRLFFQVN